MRRERVEPNLIGVGRGKRVAIVAARFYGDLADQLEDGARRALAAAGVAAEDVHAFRVPGCFEIPLASLKAARRGFDAVVALGVVIRGETPHFEFVASECARGIMDVQLESGVPIGFGILTTETRAQAEERADPERGDKGFEAASAALSLLALQP
ncbi:MAG: 6,7-dimethyl-8-ribityllumazine synthase [bacterium]|nr:6,7-dimethyl-8-ribityllumazine synthase [bacterium]